MLKFSFLIFGIIFIFSLSVYSMPTSSTIESVQLGWTTDELFQHLKGDYIVCDTPYHGNYFDVTMFRFAPVKLYNTKFVLTVLCLKGVVSRYDWYIDSVEDWTIPMKSVDQSLKDLRKSSKSDYYYFLEKCTYLFGAPELSREVLKATWKEKDITIVFDTILNVLHIERKGNTTQSTMLWPNHPTVIDSSMVKFILGTSMEKIRSKYEINLDSTSLINDNHFRVLSATYYHWGIPGDIIFYFDSIGTNISTVWIANTFFYKPTRRNTKRYFSQLRKYIGDPTDFTPDDCPYWQGANETILLTIKDGVEFAIIKSLNDWIDRMKTTQ